MTQVAIEKVNDGSPKALPILAEIARQFEAIEKRAFDLFEKHGRELGHDLEHWLQAERDVLSSPVAELVDEGKQFSARIALPGFDLEDVHVSAMPDAIVVKADTSHRHEEKSGKVCFCEFSQKDLVRRVALPSPIDVDRVSASLKDGILLVSAPKTTAEKTVPVEVKTAAKVP